MGKKKNLKQLVFSELELIDNTTPLGMYKQKEIYEAFLQYHSVLGKANSGTIKRHISEWMKYYFNNEVSSETTERVTKIKNGRVVLFIGDLHFPFEHKLAYDFTKHVYESHPEITDVIFAGDIIDNHYSSFHDADPDGMSANDEFNKAVNSMKKWYELFPKAKVCVGNHDAIPQRKAFNAGLSAKWIKTIPEMYDIDGWDFQEFHDVGEFTFVHGLGMPPTSRARALGRSVASGHLHSRYGVTSYYDKVQGKMIHAVDGGCLIDSQAYAFAYGKYGRPDIKGLTIIYDIENTPYIKQITLDTYLDGK